MAFEQKDNSGSLFVNERRTSDRHPDRTGSATIGGVEYWVSGWIKEGRDGKKPWLSMAFTTKDDGRRSDPAPHQRSGPPQGFEDDDVPF